MRHFGQALRRGREHRGISLEQVAQTTRIRLEYLQALETRDLADLPGTTFNKGFVRAYAECVGLDPQALVEAYALEEQAQLQAGKITAPPDVIENLQERLMESSSRARSGRMRYLTPILVAMLALFGVGALGMWLLPGTARPGAHGTEAPAPDLPARNDADPSLARDAMRRAPNPPAPAAAPEPRPNAPLLQDAATPTTISTPDPMPSTASPAAPVQLGTSSADSGLQIDDFGVGTRIVDRELQGRGDVFPTGTKVSFWTRIHGGQPGDFVKHVWLHEDRVVQEVALSIGGSDWRTQSRKVLPESMTGPWAAEVRDATGRVLARAEFRCVASGSQR